MVSAFLKKENISALPTDPKKIISTQKKSVNSAYSLIDYLKHNDYNPKKMGDLETLLRRVQSIADTFNKKVENDVISSFNIDQKEDYFHNQAELCFASAKVGLFLKPKDFSVKDTIHRSIDEAEKYLYSMVQPDKALEERVESLRVKSLMYFAKRSRNKKERTELYERALGVLNDLLEESPNSFQNNLNRLEVLKELAGNDLLKLINAYNSIGDVFNNYPHNKKLVELAEEELTSITAGTNKYLKTIRHLRNCEYLKKCEKSLEGILESTEKNVPYKVKSVKINLFNTLREIYNKTKEKAYGEKAINLGTELFESIKNSNKNLSFIIGFSLTKMYHNMAKKYHNLAKNTLSLSESYYLYKTAVKFGRQAILLGEEQNLITKKNATIYSFVAGSAYILYKKAGLQEYRKIAEKYYKKFIKYNPDDNTFGFIKQRIYELK